MNRIINQSKALLLLATFPCLLLATYWASLMAIGFLAAWFLYLVDTAWLIQLPLHITDVLPQWTWQIFELQPPIYVRSSFTIPAAPDVLWQAFLPLVNAASMKAAPYIMALAIIWLLVGYHYNTRLIAYFSNARGLAHSECPPLYDMVEDLSARANIAMPRLYLVRDKTLNAFAGGLGQSTYAITVTLGLLALLDKKEVEAVLAHELSHIKNQDTRLNVVAGVMVGLFGWLANLLWTVTVHTIMGYNSHYRIHWLLLPFLLVVVVPVIIGAFLSLLIKRLLLRDREMSADAGAAHLVGPSAIASALATIINSRPAARVPYMLRDMVIYLPESPGGPIKRFWRRLWSTHPSYEKRIAALVAAGAMPARRGPTFLEEYGHFLRR